MGTFARAAPALCPLLLFLASCSGAGSSDAGKPAEDGVLVRLPEERVERLRKLESEDLPGAIAALEETWRDCEQAWGGVWPQENGPRWEELAVARRRFSEGVDRSTGSLGTESSFAVHDAVRDASAELVRLSRTVGRLEEQTANLVASAPTEEAKEATRQLVAALTGVREKIPDEEMEAARIAVLPWIVLVPVETSVDGWGLSRTEILVRLCALESGADGAREVAGKAPEDGLPVSWVPQRCRVDPAEGRIEPFRSATRARFHSTMTSGTAEISAAIPSLEDSEPARIRVRFPWRSLLLFGVGLLLGSFLRPHLGSVRIGTDRNRERRTTSFLIDLAGAVAVLLLILAGLSELVAPALPGLDYRAGGFVKLACGLLAGLLSVPVLTHVIKERIRRAGGPPGDDPPADG